MSHKGVPTRLVGRTGIALSEVGIGTASLGNLYREATDAEALAMVDASLEEGFRYLDTAPFYGFGLSERRVGDALRRRSDIALSTKVGRLLKPNKSLANSQSRSGFHSPMPFEPVFDYGYDAIYRSMEDSLQRLGRAQVAILYVHDIGASTHGARQPEMYTQLTSGGGFKALEELRAAGTIGAFGIGVNETAVCREVMEDCHIDVILLANRYTLLEPHGLDELAPVCAQKGVSVIIGAPFNSGILATGAKGSTAAHYNYVQAPHAILERVMRLEATCDRYGVTLPAAALQFPLAHAQVVSVIPGVGTAQQAREIAKYYREPIPAQFWSDLISQDLLPTDAHIPKEVLQ